MIAHWPAEIKPNSVNDHASVFYDVMPTLAEIAGVKEPFESDGISFLPSLRGENQAAHEFLYWEFPAYGGQMAVRMGQWKALRKNMHDGNLTWELYDLETDPKEMNNLADLHPEIIDKAETIVDNEHTVASNERWQYEILGEK
jgi:arylsulfatase A-like enzyme